MFYPLQTFWTFVQIFVHLDEFNKDLSIGANPLVISHTHSIAFMRFPIYTRNYHYQEECRIVHVLACLLPPEFPLKRRPFMTGDIFQLLNELLILRSKVFWGITCFQGQSSETRHQLEGRLLVLYFHIDSDPMSTVNLSKSEDKLYVNL